MSTKIVFNHRIFMVLGTIREVMKHERQPTAHSVAATLQVCEERGAMLSAEAVQACFDRMIEAGVLHPAKPGEAVRLTAKGSLIADHLEDVDVWGPSFAAMSKEMLCATLLKDGVLVSQHEATERLGYSTTAIRAGMAYWIGKGEAVALKVGNQIYYRKVSTPPSTTPDLAPAPAPKETPVITEEKAAVPAPIQPPPAAPAPASGEGDPWERFQQLAKLLGTSEDYILHRSLDAFLEKLRANI